MRKLASAFAVVLLFAGVAFGTQKTARTGGEKAKSRIFMGEIYDSPCAKAGTHKAMESMMGLPDDPKLCTLKCVELGAKFVLYDAAKKTIYELDDQQKPKEFAGLKVKVTGTYDAATKTIHVEKIEAAK